MAIMTLKQHIDNNKENILREAREFQARNNCLWAVALEATHEAYAEGYYDYIADLSVEHNAGDWQ